MKRTYKISYFFRGKLYYKDGRPFEKTIAEYKEEQNRGIFWFCARHDQTVKECDWTAKLEAQVA